SIGNRLLFPFGDDKPVALKPAHGRIDRPAGQAGHFHDAKSVDLASMDGLKNHGCGMGKLGVSRHGRNCTPYVAFCLTHVKAVCYIGVWLGEEAGSCSSYSTCREAIGGSLRS